jgi:hypothetical protein
VTKKIVLVGLAASMAFLISCGFTLKGFVLLKASLSPGEKTTARFTLRPFDEDKDRFHQFVLVGVTTGGDIAVGKATWGKNGKFGGPLPMPVASNLAATLDAENSCTSNGLAFDDITGIVWKGFVTPKKIADRGLVGQNAITDVIVKAKATAGTETNYAVVGVSGVWDDDGDGSVGTEDSFLCSGIAQTTLYVNG